MQPRNQPVRRSRRLLLTLALPALASSNAGAAKPAEDPQERRTREHIAHTPTIRERCEMAEALGPTERTQSADSLSFLAANCPYTRELMLIP